MKQHYSRLSFVQAISQNDSFYNSEPNYQVSTGTVWGWCDSPEAPLVIKLSSGVHFTCYGISHIQKQSALAQGAIGQKVAFYHRGFDIQGKPLFPVFKTLLIGDEVHGHE
ncbi:MULTISPECIES: hypothetical protein [unclassified Methylophaga]|jgi:hypothetical protein|uniref:hypothetical protein n=1 Tax=unclassified Methylophaga TaxID=2629249 RepID=UPI00259C8E51|nr:MULTISPECIES: hypothetical protein [unclassified Methylophaga]|tara:strand:- start:1882 stop:2211 length:330 start_codon:yes stop_codon:yes gene_type:complete